MLPEGRDDVVKRKIKEYGRRILYVRSVRA